MTKLGAHVVSGSRNGYGELCASKPAVVLAVGEGGALLEAKQKSGGHTYTIYRHVLYPDSPPGIDQTTPAGARSMADVWYPQLKATWVQNPADYYTTINEPGGHDLSVIPNYVAYELRMIELAAADGHKLCVLNLAWGTPDDGNASGGQPNGKIEVWKHYYIPVIREAFRHGMIYGRHGYGEPEDTSSDRPFEEAAYLRSIGLNGGIVITELGVNAGDQFPGTDEFMRIAAAMDTRMREHSNIIGGCMWTLGQWQNANWQDAIPAMTVYNVANPTPKWVPGPIDPPPPNPGYKSVVFKLAQEHTADEWAGIARLAHTEYKRTMTASYDNCIVMVQDGNEESYVVVFDPDLPSQAATIQQLQAAGVAYQTRYYRVTTPPPTGFKMTHWPTRYKTVNQRWGANPTYYAQFGLPGHDGVDIKALLGTDILAVASGVVASIHTNPDTHNYGIHVRINHGDDWQTVYAHLERETVAVGQQVDGGAIIGKADSTGNSSGTHLHISLKRLGHTYTDPVTGKVWPYNLFNPEPELMRLAPEAFPTTPPTTTIDLLPYIKGDGRLYELQTVGGGQERLQTQSSGNVFWQTKGSNFEELSSDEVYIWRGLDISPGPAPSYAERPGVLRYYTAKEPGQQRARWCKRHMAIGETFTGPGHTVQFYYQDNCQPSSANSGPATNKTKLVAKHAAKTWNGITVNDVVEMTNGIETWFFARGFGLVAWSSAWGSSAISEIHAPGTRPDNIRATGCWS
jgi:murein DD-endopeptidase MepM/ murein hydrolase activator NlpD